MQLPIECTPMQLETFYIAKIAVAYDIDNGTDDILAILFYTGQKWFQIPVDDYFISTFIHAYFLLKLFKCNPQQYLPVGTFAMCI